ncbi:MAG: Membrane-associated zinc metalloprotease [uncultured Thermomicrobiales bacterium]|uniref:Membrane-associated zinc metalloprotease n=1 Tax=uncultured Thermomicrobiales bacterium TaxID=1645740 RepID=A0A6J4VIN5_9BACT|nr:MAG: Membrane-associated zinc metalloprotease [uncultured Thermomicrobiales bacterium]
MDGLLIIPVLAILIIAHELGHYWAARSVGVKVEEFGIGIPPRAKGWERNGVIWSLNWIPFGGFVRVKGEDAGDMSADSMNSKPPLQRGFFLIAGSFMNVVLALALIIALVGFLGVTQERVYVGSVVPGAPAAGAGILADDRIVRANGEEIEDSGQLIAITNDNRGQPLDLTLQRGGEELTVSVTPRENPPAGQGATGLGLLPITSASIEIETLVPGGAAETAGIQVGDRILAIDGVEMTDSVIFNRTLLAAQGETVTLTVERGGERIDLPLAVPFAGIDVTQVTVGAPASVAGVLPGDAILSFNGVPLRDAASFGSALTAARGTTASVLIERPLLASTPGSPVAGTQLALSVPVPAFADDADYLEALGLAASQPRVDELIGTSAELAVIYADVPAGEVLPTGLADAWDQTTAMVDGIRQLVTGEQPLSGLAGPVGMGQLTGELLDQTGEAPWVAIVRLMTLLSLNLAVLNLLPFPALDGGRLLFVIIEMVRGGRKIAPEKEGIVHFAGLVILLGVMFVVAFNDIRRIVEGNTFF